MAEDFSAPKEMASPGLHAHLAVEVQLSAYKRENFNEEFSVSNKKSTKHYLFQSHVISKDKLVRST